MFIDLSFFEIEEGRQADFERAFRLIIAAARDAEGCLSSELVRLDEDQRYVWVERWISREAHNAFNQHLFAEVLPRLRDFEQYSRRLPDRDAEGFVVIS